MKAYAKELLSEIDEESDWYDENSPMIQARKLQILKL
jgi:hypothetical protein